MILTLVLVLAGALPTAALPAELQAQDSPEQNTMMDPIGSQAVDEGASLEFTILAADPSGRPLTYSVSGLPPEAAFNTDTHVFSWTPSHAQSGDYIVTFTVSNANASESQAVQIRVHNIPLGDATDDGKVNILDLLFMRLRLGQSVTSADTWQADANEDGAINVLDLIVARRNMGTVIDVTPPAAITDLAAGDNEQQAVELTWTAPADAGPAGMAAGYDVRFGPELIASQAAWDAATRLAGPPAPLGPGSDQAMTISLQDLPAGERVYFAIKAHVFNDN